MGAERGKGRWKLVAISMAVAIGSALETGLVVAQWTALNGLGR